MLEGPLLLMVFSCLYSFSRSREGVSTFSSTRRVKRVPPVFLCSGARLVALTDALPLHVLIGLGARNLIRLGVAIADLLQKLATSEASAAAVVKKTHLPELTALERSFPLRRIVVLLPLPDV